MTNEQIQQKCVNLFPKCSPDSVCMSAAFRDSAKSDLKYEHTFAKCLGGNNSCNALNHQERLEQFT